MVVVGRLSSMSVDRSQNGKSEADQILLAAVCMGNDRRNELAGTWTRSALVCTFEIGAACWMRPSTGNQQRQSVYHHEEICLNCCPLLLLCHNQADEPCWVALDASGASSVLRVYALQCMRRTSRRNGCSDTGAKMAGGLGVVADTHSLTYLALDFRKQDRVTEWERRGGAHLSKKHVLQQVGASTQ